MCQETEQELDPVFRELFHSTCKTRVLATASIQEFFPYIQNSFRYYFINKTFFNIKKKSHSILKTHYQIQVSVLTFEN